MAVEEDNTPGQKAFDAQLANTISSIKSQIQFATSSELVSISSSISSLLRTVSSPKMEKQLQDLQSAVEKKKQQHEKTND